MNSITTSSTVTRTSRGLVDALFDSIDNLNAKRIDAEHARAISHTAKTIVNIATLELEARKFAADSDSESELRSLAVDVTPTSPGDGGQS